MIASGGKTLNIVFFLVERMTYDSPKRPGNDSDSIHKTIFWGERKGGEGELHDKGF
jgi:hypothetical protein